MSKIQLKSEGCRCPLISGGGNLQKEGRTNIIDFLFLNLTKNLGCGFVLWNWETVRDNRQHCSYGKELSHSNKHHLWHIMGLLDNMGCMKNECQDRFFPFVYLLSSELSCFLLYLHSREWLLSCLGEIALHLQISKCVTSDYVKDNCLFLK